MNPEMSQQLRVPAGMMPVRYKPPLPVHVPPDMAEAPFIAPEDPAHKQVQQVWVAKTKMFDLANEKDLAAYEQTWQLLSDGHGQVCEQRLDFDPKSGSYKAFLRWAQFDAYLPGALPTTSRTVPPPPDVNAVESYGAREHAKLAPGQPTIVIPQQAKIPIMPAQPMPVATPPASG